MNGLHQTAQLRMLSGPRPEDDLIREYNSAIAHLASLGKRWLTFRPRAGSLAEADAGVHGLFRLLVEMRAKQAEVGNDGA